ncbi:MAG: hypothetical protein OHK0019_18570 [Saprospiraceae bacterium]
MTPSEMLSFSLAVKTNLSSKPRYTALQALTTELTAACDAFTIAEAAAKEGGAAERILRDAKMVDLRATLEKIALQLELLASEPPDETAILDAGYQLQGVPGARVRTPLGRAEIISKGARRAARFRANAVRWRGWSNSRSNGRMIMAQTGTMALTAKAILS